MRSFIKKHLSFVLISILWPSCILKKKEVVHGPREALDIRFAQNDQFRYRYYKLSLSDSLANNRSVFFSGTFEKLGNKRFKLIPNRFNGDSVPVRNLVLTPNQHNSNSRIRINTDIWQAPHEHYAIVLHVGPNMYRFNKLTIDTNITSTTAQKLSVEIHIPDFYKQAFPRVKYQKIGTQVLTLPAGQDISFTIPVTFDHFYYENTPPFVVRDEGRYWFREYDQTRMLKGI